MLWHRWCSPLLLSVVAVWFATGWVGCAVQTAGTRVEVSSGRVRIAWNVVPLDGDDVGVYWLGRVLTEEDQERRFIDLIRISGPLPERPFVPSSKRERDARWDWRVLDRERAGAPFSMGMMLAPQRRRDWNYAIWPCGVGLVLWKMCIVSYRLGAR
ncbi:MAG TPA: hypothetical protein VD997_17850, partial [Phycisphaerales bacterium]|nr:hypothetical protein [Phycisphaerales bacterium]